MKSLGECIFQFAKLQRSSEEQCRHRLIEISSQPPPTRAPEEGTAQIRARSRQNPDSITEGAEVNRPAWINPLGLQRFFNTVELRILWGLQSSINGHYESDYFHNNAGTEVASWSPIPISRLRAIVQYLNGRFARLIELGDHKNHISMYNKWNMPPPKSDKLISPKLPVSLAHCSRKQSNKEQRLQWICKRLVEIRGKELIEIFNPFCRSTNNT